MGWDDLVGGCRKGGGWGGIEVGGWVRNDGVNRRCGRGMEGS